MADLECCICYGKKTMKTGGYEVISKCVTKQAAETLQKYALATDSKPRLRAYLSGIDWSSIVPQEIYYHRSCYKDFTRPVITTTKSPVSDATLSNVMCFVQSTVLDERELVTLQRVSEVHEKYLGEGEKKLDKRTLSDRILKRFNGQVSMWSPKYEDAFFFNNEIEKGEIIELMFKKLEKVKKEKSKNTVSEIKNVAKVIKKKIKNLPDTYTRWPPTEDELISCKTAIPQELELLITNLLTTIPISRLSERKKSIISSLCEDIIYNSRAGRFRCSKQTKLAFCIKRKTGSKTLVEWINKYGHGISYDDVNYLETTLAMDQMHQKSIRSFCPSMILPSLFVTFVWDNNDINPESIKGTQFIIISLENEILKLRTEFSPQFEKIQFFTGHSYSTYAVKGGEGGSVNAYIYCLNDVIPIVLCLHGEGFQILGIFLRTYYVDGP